ncbi:hypothetical protein C8F01DRAFT_1231421 [Mycena amicta]|nr:hypothetical protein C8F01DRAFT_1231421 [Mycena amicta]
MPVKPKAPAKSAAKVPASAGATPASVPSPSPPPSILIAIDQCGRPKAQERDRDRDGRRRHASESAQEGSGEGKVQGREIVFLRICEDVELTSGQREIKPGDHEGRGVGDLESFFTSAQPTGAHGIEAIGKGDDVERYADVLDAASVKRDSTRCGGGGSGGVLKGEPEEVQCRDPGGVSGRDRQLLKKLRVKVRATKSVARPGPGGQDGLGAAAARQGSQIQVVIVSCLQGKCAEERKTGDVEVFCVFEGGGAARLEAHAGWEGRGCGGRNDSEDAERSTRRKAVVIASCGSEAYAELAPEPRGRWDWGET